MLVLFVFCLIVAGALLFVLELLSRLRVPRTFEVVSSSFSLAGRNRPMLRLLSEDDFRFVTAAGPAGRSLCRSLRSQRRQIFRIYLRCLTRDYARLLAGIRMAMVQSGIDRPDLAHALSRNRLLFLLALARIELRLGAHALGVGKVEVGGLVDALEALRGQMSLLTPATLTAAR